MVIRVFDYPRAQIAAGLVVALLAFAGARSRRGREGLLWLVTLTVVLGYQLARIVPYAPGYPIEAVGVAKCGPGNSFRVMVANVLQTNRDAAALLARVREADPDVLLLDETDAWWERAVAPLNALSAPHRRAAGQHLRADAVLPVAAGEARDTPPDRSGHPSVRAGIRLASGATVIFYGLHPRPPVPGVDTAQRDAELVLVGREIKRAGKAALVAGDMNDVAWSDTSRLFQKVGELIDPRVGRGLYPTFPAHLPPVLRWPLDHVFFTDEIAPMKFGRLPPFGSDHLAVATTLCFSPKLAPVQDAPDVDRGDRERASETIAEGVEEEREEQR